MSNTRENSTGSPSFGANPNSTTSEPLVVKKLWRPNFHRYALGVINVCNALGLIIMSVAHLCHLAITVYKAGGVQ